MQKFSRELKDNLKSVDKEDKLNEMLKERLEREEIETKKNEKLLEELNKVADKIDKEELSKRLEELGKKYKVIEGKSEEEQSGVLMPLVFKSNKFQLYSNHEKHADRARNFSHV